MVKYTEDMQFTTTNTNKEALCQEIGCLLNNHEISLYNTYLQSLLLTIGETIKLTCNAFGASASS